VEEGVECLLAFSFVHNVAWVVEAEDSIQCIQRIQRYGVKRKRWAKRNAIEFNLGKTEAILFSNK
jgi:hypothetical protein